METGIISRVALGSMADIGYLYDAQSDNFCGNSILFQSFPSEMITLTELQFNTANLIKDANRFTEILSKLGVEPEQQVSLLTGISQPHGSWRDWAGRATSTETGNISLLHEIQTQGEILNFLHKDIGNAIDISAIQNVDATHVVIGISWGTNTVISCDVDNQLNTDPKQIKDSLSAQLENMSLSILDNSTAASKKFDQSIPHHIEIFGDILLAHEESPTTLDGVLHFLKQLPSMLTYYNEGKGLPVSYQLIPISDLFGYQNIPYQSHVSFKGLEAETLQRIIQLFDQIRETHEELNQHIANPAQCKRAEDMLKISDLKIQMVSEETSFREKLSNILIEVRIGIIDLKELDNLIRQFQSGPAALENVRAALNSWKKPPPQTRESAASVGRGAFGSRNQAPTGNMPTQSMPRVFNQSVKNPFTRATSQGGKIPAKHLPNFPNKSRILPPQVIPNLERPNPHPTGLKELNILILGETGVGKSTWINAFVNFFNYDSFQEAEAGKLFSFIPTHFSLFDEENYVQQTVSTGTDENEVQQPGQSATQESRVYEFSIGDMMVRLIDTPGIGDTRGIDQDRENFQNILSTLSHLEEIHGICILLKPNNSRLNVMFRFCIKELLTYLHRDASKNIVFCFTNSRGTFYRPGDTMPALMTLLQENKEVEIPVNKETVYCFDSEAYRFLAAIKNNPPVKFPPGERQHFASSWDKAFDETRRMLEHIVRLLPHPIPSTINLNYFRELVLKMSRPLAEINRNIQTTTMLLEDEKKRIERAKESIEDLEKMRMTKITDIQMVKLDYPKTVCAHSDCIKIVSNVEGSHKVEYVQVCHARCHQKGVPADTVGHAKLLKCSRIAFLSSSCRICGHHYRQHMHSYYDSEQVTKLVENESVRESIEQNLSATEMKQRMIVGKNMLIEEYKDELKQVEQASVIFAYFLKKNAITPYNDGLEMYLDHLIKEEEDKVSVGMRSETLDSLKRSKESYLQERSILEDQMQKGVGRTPTTEEVEVLVKNLKGLKHSGRILTKALECVNHAGNQEYKDSVLREQQVKNKKQVRFRNFMRV